MTNASKNKMEKYIPVRKKIKAVKASNVCQKQSFVANQAGGKSAMPAAA